ncbi:hypothetical protein OG559_30605 [Micromonospora sp. NBC_01405]|uniref:hypothetical protein n=1 Tax=Micromonospora sp. NBC_01405 TaxID=2903589 RepID=UPI00324BD407
MSKRRRNTCQSRSTSASVVVACDHHSQCTVERLMRESGLRGLLRDKVTAHDPAGSRDQPTR